MNRLTTSIKLTGLPSAEWTDADGRRPAFVQGRAWRLRAVCADRTGVIVDPAGLTGITLALYADETLRGGALLVSDAVALHSGSVTAEQWAAGTGQHVLMEFEDAHMSVTLPDAEKGSAPLYMQITAALDGQTTLLGAGPVTCYRSMDTAPAALPYVPPLRRATTAAEARAAVADLSAQWPLSIPVECYGNNYANSAVCPLTVSLDGGRVKVAGRFNTTAGNTSNNSTFVQFPAVFWTTGGAPINYNAIGTGTMGAGGAVGIACTPMWMPNTAASPAPQLFADTRSGVQHVGLGITAASHTTQLETAGGGINIMAEWPLPSYMSGGVRLPLETAGVEDEVIILFPSNLSTQKMVVFCHGQGAGAAAPISSGLSAVLASNYQMMHEPLVRKALELGYMVMFSRGGPNTAAGRAAWGNAQSRAMMDTAIAWVKARFAITNIRVVGTSMGGLAAAQLLAAEPLCTHLMGYDGVFDILAADNGGVNTTAGNTNTRCLTFRTAILTAHGIATISALDAALNPMVMAVSKWAGKTVRLSAVGTATEVVANGSDDTVAKLPNSDAFASRVTAGGGTVIIDTPTSFSSTGGDHGRMGNAPLNNFTTFLS